MVDTIVLRLYNMHYHIDIWRFLLEHTLINKKKLRSLLHWQGTVDKDAEAVFNELMFGDSGRRIFESQSGHLHITSSHYMCAYIIRPGYIQFNFSVPKYLYGNNIAQFVMPQLHPGFEMYKHRGFLNQTGFMYEWLIKFIKVFFVENFPDMPLRLEDIEIRRVDISFNQMFDSKQSALRYLQLQRKLEKPYSRLESNNFNNYSTGISYIGDGYSFKIYHKGTEYRTKGDKKEHARINRLLAKDFEKMNDQEKEILREIKENMEDRPQLWRRYKDKKTGRIRQQRLIFDTEFLQDMSDRILRYEMTFFKAEMSRIYKKKVFKVTDPDWQKRMGLFRELDAKTVHGSKMEELKESWQRHFYLKHRGSLRKIHDFFPFPDEGLKQHEGKYGYYDKDVPDAWFSKRLFRAMAEKFWSYVRMFEVKEMPNTDIALKALHRHNMEVQEKRKLMKGAKDTMNGSELRSFGKLMNYHRTRAHVAAIEKWGSISEWKRNECQDVPSRTFRYWKADLKKLGIDESTVFTRIPFKTNLDYQEYYILEREHIFKMKYTLRSRELSFN